MVDKPSKPKKKVYANEHPKYKDSKPYSENSIKKIIKKGKFD